MAPTKAHEGRCRAICKSCTQVREVATEKIGLFLKSGLSNFWLKRLLSFNNDRGLVLFLGCVGTAVPWLDIGAQPGEVQPFGAGCVLLYRLYLSLGWKYLVRQGRNNGHRHRVFGRAFGLTQRVCAVHAPKRTFFVLHVP